MCPMSFENSNNQDFRKNPIEGIKCAAIRYKNELFLGKTHGAAWLLMTEKYPETVNNQEGREDGFVTTEERFVNREEALEIAEAVGEVTPDPARPVNTLFSEDLKKNQE